MNLTNNELAVLNALSTNDFGDGEPGAWIWSNCINCARKPSGLEGKALSGTVSSLCQKGLCEQDGQTGRDACIRMTPLGVVAVSDPKFGDRYNARLEEDAAARAAARAERGE